MPRKNNKKRSRSNKGKKGTTDQQQRIIERMQQYDRDYADGLVGASTRSGFNEGSGVKRARYKKCVDRSEHASGGNQGMLIACSLSFKHNLYAQHPMLLLIHMIAGVCGFITPDIYHPPPPTAGVNKPWGLDHDVQTRLKRMYGPSVVNYPNPFTVFGLWAVGGPNFRCRISCDDNNMNTENVTTRGDHSIQCGMINFFRCAFYAQESEVNFFGPKRTDEEQDVDNDDFKYLWANRLFNLKEVLKKLRDDPEFDGEGDEYKLTFEGSSRLPNNTQIRHFDEAKTIHDFMRNLILYAHERINAAIEGDDYSTDVGYSSISHREVTREQIDTVIQDEEFTDDLKEAEQKQLRNILLREEMKPYGAALNHRGGKLIHHSTVLTNRTKRGQRIEKEKFVKTELARMMKNNAKRSEEVIRYFRTFLQKIETVFKDRQDLLDRWGYYYMNVDGSQKRFFPLLLSGSNLFKNQQKSLHGAPEEKLAPVQIATAGAMKYMPRDLEWWSIAMNVDYQHLIQEPRLKQKVIKAREDKLLSNRQGYLAVCASSREAKNMRNQHITKHTKPQYLAMKFWTKAQFDDITGRNRRR